MDRRRIVVHARGGAKQSDASGFWFELGPFAEDLDVGTSGNWFAFFPPRVQRDSADKPAMRCLLPRARSVFAGVRQKA